MAYTVTVSKDSVTMIGVDEFTVSVKLLIVDGAATITDKVYSKRYKSGDSLAAVKAVLLKQMQDDWTKLQNETAILNSAAFTTACSEMQTTINSYVN